MRRFSFAAVALALCALLVNACRPEAEVVDACASNDEWCLPCASDDECRFTGNPCTDTVYCAHADASIAVIDIGCSAGTEYTWPSDEACQCQGTCKYAAP